MNTANIQHDHRHQFIIKVETTIFNNIIQFRNSIEQLNQLVEINSYLVFKSNENTYWIILKIAENRQGLNRKYFQPRYPGFKLLLKNKIKKLKEI